MASSATSVQVLVPAGRAQREREGAGRRGRRLGRRRRELFVQGNADLRPRGVGEILDTGCEALASGFAPCVGLAFALWLPARAVIAWALRSGGVLAGFMELGVPQMIVQFTVQTMITTLLALYVAERIQGREVTLRDSIGLGLGRMVGAGVISLLTGAMVGMAWGASICCLGLGSYFVQWIFSVAPAVYVLERSNLFESFSRSAHLVSKSFFRWVGWFLVHTVMILPLSTPSGLLDNPHWRHDLMAKLSIGALEFDAIYLVVTSLFLAVASTFTSILLVVFYVDTRVRREGLDLSLELAAITGARRAPHGADGLGESVGAGAA